MERPILFSTPMVAALLDGRKTQTRRITGENLKRINDNLSYPWQITTGTDAKGRTGYLFSCPGINDLFVTCPYGESGDVLWVRETWAHNSPTSIALGMPPYLYKTDGAIKGTWKPSLHMPKEAARIWLKIVSTRLERLMDISEADAIAEGIEYWQSPFHKGKHEYMDYSLAKSSKESGVGFVLPESSFMSLWEKINGPDSWKANPYVWVVEFEYTRPW